MTLEDGWLEVNHWGHCGGNGGNALHNDRGLRYGPITMADKSFLDQLNATEQRLNANRADWAGVRGDLKSGSRGIADLNDREALDRFRRSRETGPEEAAVDESALFERIMGENDMLDVAFLYDGVDVARAVGRVVLRNAAGGTIGYGTAFLVSPRLILTNHHVLPAAEGAGIARIQFDYFWRNGVLTRGVQFDLDPGALFINNQELDFALCAVKPVSVEGRALSDYGHIGIVDDKEPILVGQLVNIVQHPNGDPKQVALRQNQIVAQLDNFIHYVTDTAPGSSGSPVFDDRWRLVALHHMGVPKKNANGDSLKRDGTIWKQGDPPDQLAWEANEGVRLSKIAEYIRNQALTIEQQQLINQMLSPAPATESDPVSSGDDAPVSNEPDPVPSANTAALGGTSVSAKAADPRPSATVGQPQPVVSAGGAVTWQIPILISLQLGTPAADD